MHNKFDSTTLLDSPQIKISIDTLISKQTLIILHPVMGTEVLPTEMLPHWKAYQKNPNNVEFGPYEYIHMCF